MSKYTACRVFDIKEELSITVGGTKQACRRIEAAACAVVAPTRTTAARRSSSSRCRAAVAGEGDQVL